MKRYKNSLWVMPFILGLLFIRCKKEHPGPVTAADPPLPSLQKVLSSGSFNLFEKILQKTSLLRLLDSTAEYTIFVPDDATLIAAGYTDAAIAGLPVDSLFRVFSYHLASGTYTEKTLDGLSWNVAAVSLKVDTLGDKNTSLLLANNLLYINEWQGILYLNGETANKGEVSVAFDLGVVYPVHTVLKYPLPTIYDLLGSRSEFSLLFSAIRIIDSTYTAMGWGILGYNAYTLLDSQFFSSPVSDLYNDPNSIYGTSMLGLINNVNNSLRNNHSGITFFAPTNTAFIREGLRSEDDIRNSVINQLITSYQVLNDSVDNNGNIVAAAPGAGFPVLSQVINSGITVQDTDQIHNILFTNDIIEEPDHFKSIVNILGVSSQASANLFPFGFSEQFSVQGSDLFLKGQSADTTQRYFPRQPADYPAVQVLPADRNLLSRNGVVHAIDQFLYPLNY